MIKIEKIKSIDEIKKDDIIIVDSEDRRMARLDCVDGDDMYFITVHDDFNSLNRDFIKLTKQELDMEGVIYRIVK